jgi:hypothetical protein
MSDRRDLIERRARLLVQKRERLANEPIVQRILDILNFRPAKTGRRLYGDRRTGMDYETLFECSEELGELMDSWLAAGCRLAGWEPKQQFEDDLSQRRLRLLADREGTVGYDFTRPAREVGDLGLGGGYRIDVRSGRTEAVVLFFQFITGPFQKGVERCKRCRKFYWNQWGHRNKQYCGKLCATRESATRATQERRSEERQGKLRAAQRAIRRFEQLPRETRFRHSSTWTKWVAGEAGLEVTTNFITRAVNTGELNRPETLRSAKRLTSPDLRGYAPIAT